MAGIKKIGGILLVTTIGGFLLYTSCLEAQHIKSSLDSEALTKAFEEMLSQSRDLEEKAKDFDQERLLENLGTNRLNGFYFRFDEHLQEAKAYPHPELESIGLDRGLRLDLSNNQNPFEIENGQMVLKGGLLIIEAKKGAILQNRDDLDLDLRRVTPVAIRLKVKKNDLIHLGWSSGEAIDWHDWHFFMNVHIINDNRFHTYLIEVADRLGGWLEKGRLKKIGLYFPEPDNVELDYIQLLDRQEKYMASYYGATYERMGNQMRPILYMHTPLKLGYRIKMPRKDTFLSFGMGILKDGAPVNFKVFVNEKNHTEEIFSKVESGSYVWYQRAKLDMRRWRGRNIEIVFEVDSESSNVAFLSNPILFSRPNKRFNVIMILQDALRADHLSSYGYFRKTSPFLDEFAKKGVIFENAFSQGIVTVSSYSSFMTSLYSSLTEVWFLTDRLHKNFLTLPEIMRSQGFETVGIIENLDAGMIAGLYQGFDYLSMVGEGDTDSLLKRVCDIIEPSERNLFIYIHLMDPHGPYNPPQGFRLWYEELLKEGLEGEKIEKRSHFDPPWLKHPTVEIRRALYDGEIRHNDSCLQEFIGRLKDLGILDDTLIIFTADHGEFLGEHGLWLHVLPGFIQVLHVPLIMVYPEGIPVRKRIPQNVQLLDIMPTVLDFAHIPKKDMLLQGKSLISLIKGRNVAYWNRRPCYSDFKMDSHRPCFYEPYPQASLFLNNFHLLKSLVDKKIVPENFRIFDFLSDNQEEHNLAGDGPEDLRIESDLTDFIDAFQEVHARIGKIITERQKEEFVYTQDEIESLRSLGYLQ